VLLADLIAASFYAVDKVVHFILLGLLWGTAWLFMAWAGHRQLTRRAATEQAEQAEPQSPRSEPGLVRAAEH
jgi:hypothetical protein